MMKRLLASMQLFVCVMISQGGNNTKEHGLHSALQAGNIDDTITAGNTKCRLDKTCGYHGGTSYSWCFTDYSNNWDYCCTGQCGFDGTEYSWCQSGDTWQYCGNHLYKDVKGRPCLETHQCGLHNEDEDTILNYWCYVDMDGNWGNCCSPFSPCGTHGLSFYWCYIGRFKTGNKWDYCKIN